MNSILANSIASLIVGIILTAVGFQYFSDCDASPNVEFRFDAVRYEDGILGGTKEIVLREVANLSSTSVSELSEADTELVSQRVQRAIDRSPLGQFGVIEQFELENKSGRKAIELKVEARGIDELVVFSDPVVRFLGEDVNHSARLLPGETVRILHVDRGGYTS